MPHYTTVTDMLRVLPMVGSVTSIMSSDLAAFADDAEAIIDAKLAKTYAVPVVGAPLLTVLATDIALARLLTRRMFTQEQSNKSEWPDKYEQALTMLEEIADGTLPLVTSSGTILGAASTSEAWSNTSAYNPTTTELDPERQYQDEDKLTALEDLLP